MIADHINALKEDHNSALAWGDYKAAYKTAAQIELLKDKQVLSNLGQMTVAQARTAYPAAKLIHGAYGSVYLDIDGDQYRPNLHDSGRVTGWHKN